MSPKAQLTAPSAFFSKLIVGFLSVKDVISTRFENKGISFTPALMPSMLANCAAPNPAGLSISTRPVLALITGKTLSLTSPIIRTSRSSSLLNWPSIFSL